MEDSLDGSGNGRVLVGALVQTILMISVVNLNPSSSRLSKTMRCVNLYRNLTDPGYGLVDIDVKTHYLVEGRAIVGCHRWKFVVQPRIYISCLA
jgi:hypothetical protein